MGEDVNNPVFEIYEGRGDDDLQKILLGVQSQFCEAEDKGLAPITPNQFMVKVNIGEELGFSINRITSELKLSIDTLKDLEEGRTTARSIMGEGGCQTDAREYLANSIETYRLAAEFGGFLEIVNIRNYSHYLTILLERK